MPLLDAFIAMTIILQVNNNGRISFDASMTGFTPDPLPVSGSPPFLAAYWADVDTSPRNGGSVSYRTVTATSMAN